MRNYTLFKASTFLSLIALLSLAGCSDDEPTEIQLDDTGTATQDAGDTSGSDTATSDATAPDADAGDEDGEFEKPEPPPDSERGERFFYTGVEVGRNYWGRDHMNWTEHINESWLYPGEYFVRDGHVFEGNLRWPDTDLAADVFVVNDGTKVPFRLVHVTEEGEFPTIDEIESWDEDEFTKTDTFELDPPEIYNYTLVIPPWAFDTEGAHNVQVMMIPQWEPDSEPRMLRRRGGVLSRGGDSNIHTVYYGSEEYPYDGKQFSDRQDDATTWEPDIAALYTSYASHRFLAPPQTLYDWTDVESPQDAQLGEVIESPEPTVTLELHLAGTPESKWDDNTDTETAPDLGLHLYYVRQDGEIVDHFWYEITDEPETPWPGSRDPQKVLPVDVDLPADGSETTVQVFSVPNPYEPVTEWRESEFILSVFGSNALILRYDPDKADE